MTNYTNCNYGTTCDYTFSDKTNTTFDCCTGIKYVCNNTQDYIAYSTSSFDQNTVWFPWLILCSFLGNMLLYFIIMSD